MGFYSSLSYYRPGPPPTINTLDLAAFIQAIDSLGFCRPRGIFEAKVEIKFGDKVDSDMMATTPFVEITQWGRNFDEASYQAELIRQGISPLMAAPLRCDWDIDEKSKSLLELADILAKAERSVYRAFLSLGDLTESVSETICRNPCEDNTIGFYPRSVSLGIYPCQVSQFGESKCFVGWLEMSISGYGYLYPWKPVDAVTKFEESAPIQQLVAIKLAFPNQRIKVEIRKKMGDLWPYSTSTRSGWYWGTSDQAVRRKAKFLQLSR
ncbi:MAG: hypothetical protein R3C03_22515 [Pirellulaceae bacterium]